MLIWHTRIATVAGVDDGQRPQPTNDAPREPRRRRFESVIDMWLSDDPPWDSEVLENIDELAWRLGELRAWGDCGGLRAWCDLR